MRHDQYNYYPSANPFADFAPNLQTKPSPSFAPSPTPVLRSNVSYVKGIHNLKAGATYEQTFLKENDNLGIVDPTFLGSLRTRTAIHALNANGDPIASPCTDLAPYDLTTGRTLFHFTGTRM